MMDYDYMDKLFFGYSYLRRDNCSNEPISDKNLEMGFINVFCRNQNSELLTEFKKKFVKDGSINVNTKYDHSLEKILDEIGKLSKEKIPLKKSLWLKGHKQQFISGIWITVSEYITLKWNRVGKDGVWTETIWQGDYSKLNTSSAFIPFALNELRKMIP